MFIFKILVKNFLLTNTIKMASDLRLLSTVLTSMGELVEGDNPISENFIIVFDMTQTYVTALSSLFPNDGTGGLPDQATILAGLTAAYNVPAYSTVLSADDLNNAAFPADLSQWRAPYIDGNLYKIVINYTGNTWQLVYNGVSTILSGTINAERTALIGAPVAGGAMIEFPISSAGASGVRVVDAAGAGVLQFDVALLPRVVATGAPLSVRPNSKFMDKMLM